MIREIDEADWRLFKERMPLWRERQMEKMVKNYQQILSSDKTAEEKFFKLQRRMEKDNWCTIFSVEMSSSKVNINIMDLLTAGIITQDDLEGFTPDLRETMKFVTRRR